MAQTFHIVLKSVGGQEALDAREIDLPIGSSCPIGRSSKNSTKPELLPALGNAFIDSPVISRDHAKLTADTSSGSPQVYIQDVGSMHGTMVNGERLVRNTPKQLASGDLLQFGVDVNRDKEYYVARKYTFERTLMPEKVAAYSFGFTVPDSDEEDTSLSLRRGSQDNPLTIDESDAEPEESEPKVNMLTQDRPIHHELSTSTEAQLRYSQLEGLYGEDSDYPPSYDYDSGLDDDSVAHETDSESPDSLSVVHSDNQSVLELLSDVESEAEGEIVASSMQDLVDEELAVNAPIVRDDEDFASLPGHDSFNPMSPVDIVPQVASILPPMPPMLAMGETLDPDVFNASRPPPLPPRPSAAMPSFMNHMPAPTPSARQNEQPAWYSDQMPFAPNFIGTNYGDRPALFSPAPIPGPAQVHSHHFSFPQSVDPPSIISTVQRIPTPPPFAPSDDISLVTPPSRRTKVSITEIVEERPPTPASLNKLKRKADLTDDDEAPAAKRSTSPAVQVAIQEEVSDHTTSEAVMETANENVVEKQDAEQVAIIAQRPKKQPRSIISKLKNTATFLGYGALGAVGAVAVLSNLPDTFFA